MTAVPQVLSDLVLRPGTVLISDELSAPADFLLHRFLHIRFKEKVSDCIFIAVTEDLARIRAVSSKAVLSIPERPKFTFIDFIKCIDNSWIDNDSKLPPILETLETTAFTGKGPYLVILDDVSSLEWLGCTPPELAKFSRAVKALCTKTNSTLIIRHHILEPEEPSPTFQLLLQLCSCHVDLRPLTSGRNSAISGEITIYPGPSTEDPNPLSISRENALQYRLSEIGATWFNKGTSGVVL